MIPTPETVHPMPPARQTRARRRRPPTGVITAVALLAPAMLSTGNVAAQSSEPFVTTEMQQNGETVENWQRGYFQATGIGTSEFMDNPVQMKAMALEAARVVAQARLVKLIEGVTVRSLTAVENADVGRQMIKTKAEGTIRGAVTVDKSVKWVSSNEYGSGEKLPEAQVTLRVCMQNFVQACQQHGGDGTGLYQQMQPILKKHTPKKQGGSADSTATEGTRSASSGQATGGTATSDNPNVQSASAMTGDLAEKAKTATGIIFNLRSVYSYRPDLAPVVRDENGNVVYDNDKISNIALVKKGPLQFVTSVQHAQSMKMLGSDPYIVDVKNVTGDGEIIISNEDAAVLRAADGQSKLLNEARVAVAQHG